MKNLFRIVTLVVAGGSGAALGQTCPVGVVAVNATACTVPTSEVITVLSPAVNALYALNPGGQIVATNVTVQLGAVRNAVGLRAEAGGVVAFNDSVVLTTGTGTNAAGHKGLYALGASSRITASNARVTVGPATGNSDSNVGAYADGGSIAMTGSTILTRGAGTVGGNVGLLATNAGTIGFDGGSVTTGSTNSAGALAQAGGHITLGNTALTTSGQTVLNAPLGSHGLQSTGAGSLIEGSAVRIVASGIRSHGVLAELGGSVVLDGSTVQATGAGTTDLNPAAGLKVSAGSSLTFEGVGAAVTTNASRNNGLDARGAGAVAHIADTAMTISGTRSRAIAVFDGAVVDVSRGSILADQVSAMALEVSGASSRLDLTDTTVTTTNGIGYGLRVIAASSASVAGGGISTSGVNAAGVIAGSASIELRDVAVRTAGDENAVGVLADINGTITIAGGSVTTSGSAGTGARAGSYPHALAARNPGGVLMSTDTDVLTTGTTAMGAVADDGGSISLSGNSVRTLGDVSLGLYAVVEQVGSRFPAAIVADALTVDTAGQRAYGVTAQRNFLEAPATIAIAGSAVTTHGDDAPGLRAISGGAVTASGTSVATGGLGSHGALARSSPSIVTLNTTTLQPTGSWAHGAVAETGGTIVGDHATLAPMGTLSSALFAIGDPSGVPRAMLTDSTLTNVSGATVGVAGPADVSFDRTTVSGSGLWLHVGSLTDFPALSAPEPVLAMPPIDLDDPTAPLPTVPIQPVAAPIPTPGLANVQATASTLTGAAITEPGSIANLTLRDGTIWNLTGDSNLTTLVNDPSLILFSPPSGGQFKTLTVVDYVGEGQSGIGLNTFLEGDGSPSDKLVIDGGTATGQSLLAITNAGGRGALTRSDGILVVDAIDGGTTDPAAFALARTVAAGPYEYTLHRGGPSGNTQSWFLRSDIDCASAGAPVPPCPSPPSPPVPPSPPGPPDPQPPNPPGPPSPTPPTPPAPIPNYRVEVSLYTALPALALRYGWATLGNLHERVGEEEQLRDRSDLRTRDTLNGAWLRVIGESGDVEGSSRGIYNGGPRYDYDLTAIQAGMDIYAKEHDNRQRDHAGLYLGQGRIHSDVTHAGGGYAGTDAVKGTSLGAYWTHFWREGAYLDLVWQGTWAKASARSARGLYLERSGFGWAASAEGGYPFHDDDQVYEPQAQVIYQTNGDSRGSDNAALVRFRDVESLAARLGFRWANTWTLEPAPDDTRRLFTGWLRLNLWREFRGQPRAEFSSADGYVPFKADMKGSWWQLNAGMTWQLDRNTSFYGNFGYQRGFGRSFDAWDGKLGLRWNW